MNSTISVFEQFLRLFGSLKRTTGGTPSRINAFYLQNQKIKAAADELYFFLLETDFEDQIFRGTAKQFSPVPQGFEARWDEYKSKWESEIGRALRVSAHQRLLETGRKVLENTDLAFPSEDISKRATSSVKSYISEHMDDECSLEISEDIDTEYSDPDPSEDCQFESARHNPASAVALGINYLESHDIYPDQNGSISVERIDNICRISTEAFHFFEQSVGLDFNGIFRRWQSIPPIFYPRHVTNLDSSGQDESLFKLINDAIVAYVMGATAAAIITCRSALETVLKRHYGKGAWDNESLHKIIVLAERRYRHVDGKRLQRLRKEANTIVHQYSFTRKLSLEEEKTIVEFLLTVKHLVQNAPYSP